MSFGTAYATKKRAGKGAKMDQMECGDSEAAMHQDADMIARIMHKRKEYAAGGAVDDGGTDGAVGNEDDEKKKGASMFGVPEFSEGGRVANDVGVAEADKEPAEYDDLVLRDNLEDGAPSGNERGSEALDEEDADIVAKVMKSRKK